MGLRVRCLGPDLQRHHQAPGVPSQQESACGATEARQEKVILEVVRKGIFVVKCWSIC